MQSIWCCRPATCGRRGVGQGRAVAGAAAMPVDDAIALARQSVPEARVGFRLPADPARSALSHHAAAPRTGPGRAGGDGLCRSLGAGRSPRPSTRGDSPPARGHRLAARDAFRRRRRAGLEAPGVSVRVPAALFAITGVCDVVAEARRNASQPPPGHRRHDQLRRLGGPANDQSQMCGSCCPCAGGAAAGCRAGPAQPSGRTGYPARGGRSSPPLGAAAPATRGPVGLAALPHDLSPWSMFQTADSVVKAVIIGLAIASVVTWTVWLAKAIELIDAAAPADARALAALDAARHAGRGGCADRRDRRPTWSAPRLPRCT